MCTLAIYVRQFRDAPLVVAANRDEFLARPASAPMLLAEHPRIAGGRDLDAGGTWLAISEHGMVAGLLNRRTAVPPDPGRRSRGRLPLIALAAASAAEAERAIGAERGDVYNAFNLLVADRERAWVAQNHGRDVRITPLTDGVHVLTNLDVNDPTCPKIARSHRLFAGAGARYAQEHDAGAFRATLRTTLADHSVLLDPRQPDALGALCVHADRFGTRCSSLLFLDARGTWQHWFADGPPCRRDYEPALVP